ncbi:FAD-dependent oxidoreductase [Chitinophaga sp. GCM10012297]|uniref:FAD-dependent oxidoreductase n=1 Tax=Chitinophaga chungangae TaxID=2821488 RepID=A0ABS3Y8J4_9BACT|nr:FAD-dependent oxidoreductase [Chitinophaga chungangae]MBO9150996.1 FAD-dependent oxidoreductase [Chitinophaga chungangae]
MNRTTRTGFRWIILLLSLVGLQAKAQRQTDLLIVGGGASGTMAGIQAARMGVQALVIEETDWLGGMLTSAGVSAIDGNHRMPSGLWGEFRAQLYNYYGGPEKVFTGWVSNTLFEPHVGNNILKKMAAKEKNLQISYQTRFQSIRKENGQWLVTVAKGKRTSVISAKLVIDATELGDVMAAAGAKYNIGMDAREETGETQAPAVSNDIIQDLTYVVVLKDYGKGANKTIRKPEGYNADEFKHSCDVSDPASFDSPDNNCNKMIQYGRLPNNKYMINWPKSGNDFYLNIIEKTPAQREEALKAAKLHSLRFIYYLQTELGYKNLGIADDEFPTADKLPMIPYHRESRRLKGEALLTVNHVAKPYEQPEPLYRTGIAVGDYTIDHHHEKNPAAPKIDFVKIRVPSYNVPLGSLVPNEVDGLIVAEKSIGVTNIVNGATRLQPVVLGIGQAAGALAAVSLKQHIQPRQAAIRDVQQALLDSKAYIMPFIDVNAESPYFAAIQRIGATGILKGSGVPYQWANQTWFYPDDIPTRYEVMDGLRAYYEPLRTFWGASGEPLSLQFLLELFEKCGKKITLQQARADWKKLSLPGTPAADITLNRAATAVLIDHYLDPFRRGVNFAGQLQ